uniref:EGF-like domain-containing protein n=1 Tax=Latimeria chalumnae TaxID=7897 RepID=H3BAG9_LATCH
IDECHDESNCVNGQCINTRGLYQCNYMPSLLYEDMKRLPPSEIDIDECQDPSNCKFRQCVNTPGSYYCVCRAPRTLDAIGNECVMTAMQNGKAFSKGKMILGVVPQCHLGFQTTILKSQRGILGRFPREPCTFSKSCYMLKFVQIRLWTATEMLTFSPFTEEDSSGEDSDECCCMNGRFVRLHRSGFSCECLPGFQPDPQRSKSLDIDKCREFNQRGPLCKNARCVNTSGSYYCVCRQGFMPAWLPNICIWQRRR